jgi:hypothetical protein
MIFAAYIEYNLKSITIALMIVITPQLQKLF